MRFNKPLAAAIGLSMMSSPLLAQSAAPLSLAPVGAQLNGASDLEGEHSYILPGLVILGVLLAAILYTSNKDSGIDNPASP